jgi:hypothetical protein
MKKPKVHRQADKIVTAKTGGPHMTAVLARLAGKEEAEALRLLREHSGFAAKFDEAAHRWDEADADYRANVVCDLSEIVREAAPDLAYVYLSNLLVYLGVLIAVAAKALAGATEAEIEAFVVAWRPYPVHLSVGNPLVIKRQPDGSFTVLNPAATTKREHWDEWTGFLRALRPEGQSGRPEGRKDSRPRKSPYPIKSGDAGRAYEYLAAGIKPVDIIKKLWPDIDATATYARKKLAKLLRRVIAERGDPRENGKLENPA